MSRRVGNTIIIEATSDAKCELCGKIAELRPYGPQGESICASCGMKNMESTKKMMEKVLFGTSEKVRPC